MFPFQDYKKISFSNIDDGDNEVIYTTEWSNSYIVLEWQNSDINGGETILVFVNQDYNSLEDETVFLGKADVADGHRTYPIILPSGVQVRAASGGENNFDGVLHVFRLPDL